MPSLAGDKSYFYEKILVCPVLRFSSTIESGYTHPGASFVLVANEYREHLSRYPDMGMESK